MSNVIKSNSTLSKDIPKRVIGLKVLQTIENNQIELEQQDIQIVSKKMLDDAKEQADKIVKDAIAYSNSVRQQVLVEKRNWEEEQEELYRKTSEEGFQSGMIEGREQGYQEYSDLLTEARKIIDASKHDYNQYLDSSEEVILKLSMKVAEKVIGIHLSQQPEDFTHLVKKAIKEVKEHSDITIQVHPRFYPIVIEQKEDLTAILNRETNLFIYPNEDLGEADCEIESSFGKINASVDTQLSEIKEKLLSLLLEE
ncbi:flagellar assembly protein FliH [Fredinandcohnia sp. QZ13]|uniref:flagellar assembly protein FliH n=1 Tax=Fredinandcohnia sp. QZ13 TaxID=3073144 RepID=UPI0028531003|nr:flagellar assembly protein FliH [Fredinandcohnia sp. QZ13]MDR4886500.1 flagellar assembly protein FliH [Fredinandcohnia sp. QZ13]